MEKKDEILQMLTALQEEGSEEFSVSEKFTSSMTQLLSDLTSRKKDKEKDKEEVKIDMSVLCKFMTEAENEILWEMLLRYANSLINTLTEDEESDPKEEREEGDDDGDDETKSTNKMFIIATLRKVATVLAHYMDESSLSPRPSSFFQALQALHNILVPLDEDITGARELKQAIARLCEKSWLQEEAGCELLMTQLIPFLLLNVLDSCNNRDSDVKRLYAIRDAFALLDYEDESIQTIQGLLLRCFTDPSFLKIPEGRRFLSFTFTLHSDMHNLIVGVMKPQLGTGNKSVSQAYGDILYRAWRDLNVITTSTNISKNDSISGLRDESENDSTRDEELSTALMLQASLEDNLQDMVHNAIHAKERKYFSSLRYVLNVFHENKNNKNVDSLLLKVYGPIMWRSLRCAHPVVRMQAAIIFFDCFPLQSSDHSSNIRETEQLLQKQFDLLNTLLKDIDHRVRAVAAYGVCKILRTFWEVIPTGTTHQILTYVVSTLGVDAACANVRANVINGMSELLDNPLSHVALKGLLPLLSNSVHDYSERVRAAFLRLLCKIKTTRGFKFYDIVSIDQLCNQLSADVQRPAICSIMTELLLNSFYPRANNSASNSSPIKSSEYGVEQIRRCLQFSRTHPEAAVVFYSNLYLHTSVGSSTKMCVGLWNTLRDNIQKTPTSDFLNSARNNIATRKKHKGSKKRGKKHQKDEDEDDVIATNTLESFELSLTLCQQILQILNAIIKSTFKLLLTNQTYKLSKEMLQTHITPGAMREVLVRLLDFQKVYSSDDIIEGVNSSDDASGLIQLCISELLEVISKISSISGRGSDELSVKSEKSKDSSMSLFTPEGILDLYFSSSKQGDSDRNYAFSILDAVIALQKTQVQSHPKKSSKKSSKSRSQPGDFVLWPCLREKVIAMYDVLGVSEENTSELSSVQNLGKKRKKEGSSKSQRNISTDDVTEVVIDFYKAVQLLQAIFEGSSISIVEFRDEIFNSEDMFVRVSNIFSQIRIILDSLVSNESILKTFDDVDDVALSSTTANFSLHSSMTLSVKLWLSFLCQRIALKENTSTEDCDMAENAAHQSPITTELNASLSWINNTVIAAFKIQCSGSNDDREDSPESNSPVKSKLKLNKEDSDDNHLKKLFSTPSMKFLDNVLAACLLVFTDALMSGIATQTILSHIQNWVADLSVLDEMCAPFTINALSRLAFAIYSGKIIFPLPGHSYFADDMDVVEYKREMKAEMRAFDASLDNLWGECVDCTVRHLQHSTSTQSEDTGSENSNCDGTRTKTDNIDMSILYSMLHVPILKTDYPTSQSSTKRVQYDLSTRLIKRLLKVVSSLASVEEGTIERTIANHSAEQDASKICMDIIEWKENEAQNALFLDLLLRKVSSYENTAKFTLSCVRSMLLDAVEKQNDDNDSNPGRNDALLLAVLLKQVMAKSMHGKARGNDIEQTGVSGDGSVSMIVSTVEQILESGKENSSREQKQFSDVGKDIDDNVTKSTEMSRQIASLLKL